MRAGAIRAAALSAVAAAGVAAGACEEQEFEPPDREEQVAEADRLYSRALFDSVTWASDSARVQRGNSIYASECRQCHGTLGRGSTEYADERNLDVPSLVEEEWEHAGDVDAVRRRIFIGHAEGMPTWGIAHLGPREIDASAYYVLNQLRPDVLEGGASLPGEDPAVPSDTADPAAPSDTAGGG